MPNLLSRLLYRYEPTGVVDKNGKTYKKYTKVRRISRRHLRNAAIALVVAIVAIGTARFVINLVSRMETLQAEEQYIGPNGG